MLLFFSAHAHICGESTIKHLLSKITLFNNLRPYPFYKLSRHCNYVDLVLNSILVNKYIKLQCSEM